MDLDQGGLREQMIGILNDESQRLSRDGRSIRRHAQRNKPRLHSSRTPHAPKREGQPYTARQDGQTPILPAFNGPVDVEERLVHSEMLSDEEIQHVSGILDKARQVIVYTGAGISTNSGIKVSDCACWFDSSSSDSDLGLPI